MADDSAAEPGSALEPVAAAPLTTETVLPPGVQPSRNYMAAVELGHVLAQSGYYKDARDPAQAAVKVMIGMDLGVSPTAALQAIHTMEEQGKIVFLIEAKLLAAVVKARPDVEYKILERGPEKVVIDFERRNAETGKMEVEGPSIEWTIEKAKKAVKGFDKKPTWKGLPEVMLTWRTLAEGFRLYFPDVLAGQPIYAMEEFDVDAEDMKLRDALAPAKPQPLDDAKAETLRAKAKGVYDELKEANPQRLIAGRFASMIAGAEHSHEQLENVVASLEDLRDTERTLAERKAELTELVGEDDAKSVIEAAERRGSNRERIEAVEKAIAAKKGDDDAANAS